MREWQYWTRNKLEILAGYLPAFNQASAKARHRVYVDLMAGQPFNRDRATGVEFDGSARLALAAKPGFTKLAFCEMATKAAKLQQDLPARYPDRINDFTIYPGDCNATIDQVLRDLSPYRRYPTFVFVDQQAAEVAWRTLEKAARFRDGIRKSELWILASPAMVAKGVKGTNADAFVERVDRLYGTKAWQTIQAARDADAISAEEYRDEMVNLLRRRLEKGLGYANTARIPMRMLHGMPIYDMVFATDHEVGQKIMTHLYRKAAEREPEMLAEAREKAADKRREKQGLQTLFDVEVSVKPSDITKWEPKGCLVTG
ncbi:three-Cys-motif partner protein TcmP [Plantactinospora endophytica]|uniref:Three-Cys-motif partner protein TcmP n=1 Tax=Plantactinospora endophytica TaxID=673535 RepID=A0ABQ4E878_9ACTN|nr:three-Cys-motif partner protein TcmP [Plantactinospora endophytica]GIG90918.1 hypothetical protein Pen02_58540 [Plantactinospora endophytica]